MRKHELLHRAVYKIARSFVPLMVKKFNFHTDFVPKLNEPFLMLANHTSESDMAMAGYASPHHMYFIGGEHLLRSKFGKYLKIFFDIIPAPRGGNMLPALREMKNRSSQGCNLMLFPEGCRSFNGETLKVNIGTGKLVKSLGCALVTYRITGGYFIAPRWAYEFRTGPAEGKIMSVIPSEKLKEMSAQEITDLINADLYVNAIADQKNNQKKYLCKNPAEGLENYLIKCPECGAYDSMETEKNHFKCVCCGTGGTVDDYGFFHEDEGKPIKFHDVYDWGKWIENQFDSEMSTKDSNELLFTDTDVVLYEICSDHSRKDLESGSVKIYRDRFVFNQREFRLRDISAMSLLYFGKSVLFTTREGYFGITGEHFHAWKIERLYTIK